MTRKVVTGLATAALTSFASSAWAEETAPLRQIDSAISSTDGQVDPTSASVAGTSTPPIQASSSSVSLVASDPATANPPALAPSTAAPQPPNSAKTPANQSPLKPHHGSGCPMWWKAEPCKSPESEDLSQPTTDCSGVFALRGSITHLGHLHNHDAFGLMISTEGEEYVRRGPFTARGLHRFAIGGGGAGFEGTMQGGWAGGVRLSLPPNRRHGPFVRLGFFGYLRGNNDFYGSLIELPQLQLGYQYQNGKTVLELGATGGAVLVGRSRTGDAERRVLGHGFERGGYVAIQLPWLRLGASAMRLPVHDRLSTPVDVVEGTLCARLHGVALCTDARATVTDAFTAPGTSTEVTSVYAGLSLGITRE